MSAIEVIEQIKQLPREEQKKVAAYLDEIVLADKPGSGVSGEFKQMADEVFNTNAELFRKLAQ